MNCEVHQSGPGENNSMIIKSIKFGQVANKCTNFDQSEVDHILPIQSCTAGEIKY